MKSYICPNCGEKQDGVIQWQTESVSYLFSLATKDGEETNDRVGGDHESFNCPRCGEKLSPDLEKKFRKHMGW